MQDRRNFYRALHVQPDAPFELIRTNYRALMSKLAAHPDLGGEHWGAAHLTVAYATLRDPAKRAEYDRKLLEKYDIETLSLGRQELKRPKRSLFAKHDPRVNRRNYYRILGIQVDAPKVIVESAYKTLRARAGSDRDLIDEAFAIVGGERERRDAYDALLGTHGHLEAVKMLARASADAAQPESEAAAKQPHAKSAEYQALITRYCPFCRTPFSRSHVENKQSARCLECDSPLLPPPESLLGLGRREVTRMSRDDRVLLSIHWPEEPMKGQLLDLSPTGLRCTTAWPLDLDDRVKVEAQRFTAVGEVAHCSRQESETMAGLRFLTVDFRDVQGAFLSIEV